MIWSFAIINGKVGEIYFNDKNGRIKIFGHCYVKREDFIIPEERKALEDDIQKIKIVYKDKEYRIIKFGHRPGAC